MNVFFDQASISTDVIFYFACSQTQRASADIEPDVTKSDAELLGDATPQSDIAIRGGGAQKMFCKTVFGPRAT